MDRPTVLTDAAVRRATPPLMGRREIWCAALGGFGVRITSSGHRSFVLLTRLRGQPIRLTLGRYPGTSLAAARTRAKAALDAVARGEDPREAKRPAPPAQSVETIGAEFIEKWSKVRKRTWDEDERILDKYVLPRWKGRRLDTITRADIVALVDGVATNNGPIQANRVLAFIKKLFAWSLDRGLLDMHPAARLAAPAPERTRDRVLSDTEIKKLWKAWEAMTYPFGTALQVLLLTAARRGEVEEMAWSEVDLAAGLWTLAADRTKVGRPHLVPLSTPAVALLARVPRFDGCPYVFTTRGTVPVCAWSDAVEDATKASGVNGWRLHDLRRSARTGFSRIGVAADVAEQVLGHVLPRIRGVYDRHDFLAEKRDALERWAAHLTALVSRDG